MHKESDEYFLFNQYDYDKNNMNNMFDITTDDQLTCNKFTSSIFNESI